MQLVYMWTHVLTGFQHIYKPVSAIWIQILSLTATDQCSTMVTLDKPEMES